MPAVGVKTIKIMRDVGASVLAVEAGKTLAFDKEEMVALADENRIAIIGIE
jgi:DUF1009 family protein